MFGKKLEHFGILNNKSIMLKQQLVSFWHLIKYFDNEDF